MTVRWMKYSGPSIDGAECQRVLASELGQLGDAIVVWVNEGDIIAHGKELRPQTSDEIMRDALNWVSNNVDAHPENIRQVVNAALRRAKV